MVAADQRLVGRCAAAEGHARLGCQRYVYVEPERPFRMQEADCRVDDDVAGEEQLFAAGTDIYPDVAWRVTRGAEGGHARHYLRRGLDQAQPGGGQFQIRLRNTWLLLRRQFVGQIRGAPEGELGLGGDEFGRGKQQRCVLAVADAPQVVEVKVSEQDRVDIARRVARGGEVAKQPAGRSAAWGAWARAGTLGVSTAAPTAAEPARRSIRRSSISISILHCELVLHDDSHTVL